MRTLNAKLYALLLACALLPFAAASRASAAPAPPQTSAPASPAGTYHYKTHRPGEEGYDNTLEVEDKGGGRLRVKLSGTYIYKANGEETMHEGGGEGDATVRGNVATASVTPDGGGEPCRVIIIFDGGEAGVKSSSACGFNVQLDGTYRSAKAGAAGVGVGSGGTRQIRFDVLNEFVNELQSNKTGMRYVITSVPAEKVKLVKPVGPGHKGLSYLMFDEDDGDVSTAFVTSAALVKSLRGSPLKEAATLRVTAVLVEFLGEFDFYRSSFVTKVEGLGEDGSVVWVAAGPEPVKVKMRQ